MKLLLVAIVLFAAQVDYSTVTAANLGASPAASDGNVAPRSRRGVDRGGGPGRGLLQKDTGVGRPNGTPGPRTLASDVSTLRKTSQLDDSDRTDTLDPAPPKRTSTRSQAPTEDCPDEPETGKQSLTISRDQSSARGGSKSDVEDGGAPEKSRRSDVGDGQAPTDRQLSSGPAGQGTRSAGQKSSDDERDVQRTPNMAARSSRLTLEGGAGRSVGQNDGQRLQKSELENQSTDGQRSGRPSFAEDLSSSRARTGDGDGRGQQQRGGNNVSQPRQPSRRTSSG